MNAPSLNELRKLILRHAGAGGGPVRSLPAVMLMKSQAPTPPFPHVAEPAFALVAQGRKRIDLGGRTFDYGSGQYLVVSVDLPISAHVIEASEKTPFLGFGFTLKPEAVAALLLEVGISQPVRSDPPGIAVSDLTNDLVDPVVRLLRLLDRPADIAALAASIEREILWRLISGTQGAMVRQIGLADSRMAQVSRAIHWIRRHYAEAIRVEELARISSMSVTSFHRHFRDVTSMTPIQFQRQIRLQTARSKLMSGPSDVAEVGFAVGYGSPSQFSREYRRQFGRPPGEDGELLRKSNIETK